ncbi:MAG TPA: ThuA domain-containing protein [Pirellulaceae bacterium]|nr:ThuA domain-containing protein [Pirellulaceae bacterium]
MRTTLATLALVLFSAVSGWAQTEKPVSVLIITGDHGHNWKETTPFLKEVLTKAGHKVAVTEKPRLDLIGANLAKYDVLLFNYRNTAKGAMDNADSVWNEDNQRAFVEAIESGKGLVVYHHASSAFTGAGEFDKLFEKVTAGGWRKQGHHGKMHEFTVKTQKEHPITRGIKSFNHGRDELYQNSLITEGSEVLVTAYSDLSKDPKNTGKDEPMVWVNKFGKGRVCQNALGHDVEAMKSAGFQTLLVRCVEWAGTGETTTKAPAELGK